MPRFFTGLPTTDEDQDAFKEVAPVVAHDIVDLLGMLEVAMFRLNHLYRNRYSGCLLSMEADNVH